MEKCGFVHLISLWLIAMRPQRNDDSCKTFNLFYEGLVVSKKSFLRPECGTRELSETDRCSHWSCHTDVASAMKTKLDSKII